MLCSTLTTPKTSQPPLHFIQPLAGVALASQSPFLLLAAVRTVVQSSSSTCLHVKSSPKQSYRLLRLIIPVPLVVSLLVGTSETCSAMTAHFSYLRYSLFFNKFQPMFKPIPHVNLFSKSNLQLLTISI